MEDLYETLGVDKNATADEIKKSYKNLAFKYHPDRNAGNTVAEEKFKQVNAAYSVLGDEEKRRQYDSYSPFSSYGQNTSWQSQTNTNWQNNSSYTDPYWEFFKNTTNKTHKRYTYTWQSQKSSPSTRSQGVKMFLKAALRSLLCFGVLRFVSFIFPLNMIFLYFGVQAIVDTLSSIKYIFARNE